MSTPLLIVSVVAGMFVLLVCSAIVGFLGYALWVFNKKLIRTMTVADKAGADLAELLAQTKKQDAFSGYIAGHAKAAFAMARGVESLNESVKGFRSLLVGPGSTGTAKGIEYPTEEDANTWFAVQELLAKEPHLSNEEAKMRVRQDEEYRTVLPNADQLGVL